VKKEDKRDIMKVKSYDYKNRKGIEKITWEDFGRLAMKLAEVLSEEKVDIIVGIARAGLFPATAVSCMLRKEMYPVRVTRRFNDIVVRKNPEWKARLPQNVVKDRVVAIIDEIADSGNTLSMVREVTKKQGAFRVITATLFSHTWAQPVPDIVVLETDALVVLPWDYQIYMDGEWIIHPEYQNAMRCQKRNIR
jgi:hypoxanthine phosphoribosyltransferase